MSTTKPIICYNKNMNLFKYRLKELRKEKNLSQKQLSLHIKYGQSTISEWEKGKIEPTADALLAIADYFNVSVDYLLGRENIDGTKVHISNSFNNNNGKINFKG